jgi:hypothetical protein
MPKKPKPPRAVPVASLRKLVRKWRSNIATPTHFYDGLCFCASQLDRLIKEAR